MNLNIIPVIGAQLLFVNETLPPLVCVNSERSNFYQKYVKSIIFICVKKHTFQYKVKSRKSRTCM